MRDKLTIIIPTSPIPSHPSTRIIDECIGKIREQKELSDCEIAIMFDGVYSSHESKRDKYYQYRQNLEDNNNNGKYGRCQIISFSEHTHQANMTNNVLQLVTTPYIMFVEHDTAPIGDIPFDGIINVMDTYDFINYIRFHIFHEFLKEHDHLMLGEQTFNGIKFMRTIQWSQRPHIAKKEWYLDILNTYFNGEKTMIEDVMHGVCQDKFEAEKKDTFGIWIYSPDGNKLRSYHSDGRETDEKIITG